MPFFEDGGEPAPPVPVPEVIEAAGEAAVVFPEAAAEAKLRGAVADTVFLLRDSIGLIVCLAAFVVW